MPVSTVEVSIAILGLSFKSLAMPHFDYSRDISKGAERALKGPTLVGKPGFPVAHQTVCQSRSTLEMAAARDSVVDQRPAWP